MEKNNIFTFEEYPKRKIKIYNQSGIYMGYIQVYEDKFHFFSKSSRYFDDEGLMEVAKELKRLNSD